MRFLLVILLMLPCQIFAQSQYAKISSVSVDTNSTRKVTVRWQVDEPISSNQVYAIYRWQDGKWVQIVDSILSATRFYQDPVAHPFEQPERYAISTSVPGQKDSPLSDFHQTVFLRKGNFDKCRKSLSLVWSGYKGARIENYSVYGKTVSGKSYSLLGTVTDTTFKTSELNLGAVYRFYVVANMENGEKSMSNLITDTIYTPILANESLIIIDTIQNNGGRVRLSFSVDNNSDLLGYAIQKADSGDFVTDSLYMMPCNDRLEYVSVDEKTKYRLSAIDYCGEPSYSTKAVSPILADAETETVADAITVKWNSSFGGGEMFSLYCSVDGGKEVEYVSGVSEYEQIIPYSEIGEDISQNFCIKVVSVFDAGVSQSNTVCVQRQPDIIISNAFTPNGDGLNDTFGPTIKNAQIQSFEFIVYDRYGGRVFSTADPNSRWDGTCGGKYVAEGGYLYYIKIVTTHKQLVERNGSINVIYP